MTHDVDWLALRAGIMDWWEPSRYDFPWRSGQLAEWRALVTEILLQRTRANAVAAVHVDFFTRFPSPYALGEASVDEIREEIYSLGLLWRAKHLRELGAVTAQLADRVPDTREEIERLPGVGPYVAGAFLALHRNQHASFVDANVVRLLGRYVGFEWDGETRRKKWFLDLVDQLFDHDLEPRSFGYALLDFTREVCGRSGCDETCPASIRSQCAYYGEHATAAP